MKLKLLLLLTFTSLFLQAQKKLVPVSQSPLTGIGLPPGTKQDGRFLSELAGKTLLEMETKKAGMNVGKTEFLIIPPTSDTRSTIDSLKQILQNAGWMVSASPTGDPQFFWIDRNNTRLIAYLSGSKKEISLYFGEIGSQPVTEQPQQQVYSQQGDPNMNQPAQPAVQDPPVPGNQQNTGQAAPQQISVSTGANQNGKTIATSNFDDGWVATPQADWVQVMKNGITVNLHYALSLPDELRSGDGDPILNYFWNLLVVPRYTCSEVKKMPFDPYAYKRTYFMEAAGTENATGQTVYIAFRILINSGIASCVEIKASSKENYTVEFPNLEKTEIMTGYNRFAISPADVTGKWKESTGGFAQYYNVYSGNYAGMNAVSITSQLTLGTDGQLLLEHKGASGMVGNQQFFSESFKGPYTLTNWDLSFTDQQGKQTAYHAYYQAVKNGRVLYLQNKLYSGQEYFFVKAE